MITQTLLESIFEKAGRIVLSGTGAISVPDDFIDNDGEEGFLNWDDPDEGEICITRTDMLNGRIEGISFIACKDTDGVERYVSFEVTSMLNLMDTRMRTPEPIPENIGVIDAECHSDDHEVEVKFNAAVFFNSVDDVFIKDLAKCGWGYDYPADQVAQFSATYYPELNNVFNHTDCHGERGFECSVDEVMAHEWLKERKPELYKELFG